MRIRRSLTFAASLLSIILTSLLVTSCALLEQQTGIVKADSTPQRLAYAVTTIASIREEAAQRLEKSQISLDTARKVQAMADTARKGIDQAETMYFDPVKPNKTGALQALEQMEQMLVFAHNLLMETMPPGDKPTLNRREGDPK